MKTTLSKHVDILHIGHFSSSEADMGGDESVSAIRHSRLFCRHTGLWPYLGGADCTGVSQFGRQLETAAEWAVRRVNSHGVLRGGVLGEVTVRSAPFAVCDAAVQQGPVRWGVPSRCGGVC